MMHRYTIFNILILLFFFTFHIQSQNNSFNPSDFEILFERARETNSDALLILHNGEPIIEWYSNYGDTLIYTMSVTKPIVGLAIGRLLTDGKLDSLDQPVHTLYPEWNQGQKNYITIRHLLNHTSGLQNHPNAHKEIYPAPDFVQLALAAELDNPPGTNFAYNNKAVNLLPGIVEQASGKKIDAYLYETVFSKLGIDEYHWSTDEAGNPVGMADLLLHPRDLARIGQLALNNGRRNNTQLIKKEWFEKSLTQAQEFSPNSGLLWMLMYEHVHIIIDSEHIDEMRKTGVPDSITAKFEQAIGRYESENDLITTLHNLFDESWQEIINHTLPEYEVSWMRVERGDIVGYHHEGYLGQYLVILPEQQLVAVRMIRYENADGANTVFTDFRDLLINLTQ